MKVAVSNITLLVRGRFIKHDRLRQLGEAIARKYREVMFRKFYTGSYDAGSSVGHETYSDNYAALKKGGRKSPVNLFDTGEFHGSIQHFYNLKKGNKFIAGVQTTSDHADRMVQVHDRLGAGQGKVVRKFWSMTDDQVREIIKRASSETDYGIDVR
jgi:hypothetical protein